MTAKYEACIQPRMRDRPYWLASERVMYGVCVCPGDANISLATKRNSDRVLHNSWILMSTKKLFCRDEKN
jgi:hypothetical protein